MPTGAEGKGDKGKGDKGKGGCGENLWAATY